MPSCPFSFEPHVQTSPLSNNATANSLPPATIGVAVLPACVTVTLISDIIPESCVIVIIAVPVCVPAVITPFTTVATFSLFE